MTISDLRATAQRVLRKEPDPPVRVRLLRDVLRVPETDARLLDARAELDRCPAVIELTQHQDEDGSWGRLHSQDMTAKRRIPTTEFVVERAVALGLTTGHPILERAATYLVDVLEGRRVPRDPPEKNDRWPTGVRLFAAATLSQINPDHRALDEPTDLWRKILLRTFEHGSYDAELEAEAHRTLTGATVSNSYLVLSNRYALMLLSSRAGAIPNEVSDALLAWIRERPEGIGYLSERLDRPPNESAGSIDRWIRSWELLSRFPLATRCTQPVFDWIEERRNEDGFWDLGRRSATSVVLPLSDDWRKRGVRTIDWTARMLLLQGDIFR